jgi:hypothetical protein
VQTNVGGRKREPYTGDGREKSKLADTEKFDTDEEQSQEPGHQFL